MVFWVNPFDEVIRMKSLKIGWRCLDFHWVQVDFKVQTLQIEERIIKLPRGCKRSGWMFFSMFFQRNFNIETYWMTLAYCQFTPIFDGQNHGFPSDFPQIFIDRFPSEADLGHGRSRAFRSAGAILLPRRAGSGHRLRCGATSELWAGHWGWPEDCLMICFTNNTAGLLALIWVIHGFFHQIYFDYFDFTSRYVGILGVSPMVQGVVSIHFTFIPKGWDDASKLKLPAHSGLMSFHYIPWK
jgi:hypothetical protein